jgi:hypothetical protein
VHAGTLRIIDRLAARDADGIFLLHESQGFFVNTRPLDNGDEVVRLLKDLMGAKLPIPVVLPSSQSLARYASSAL